MNRFEFLNYAQIAKLEKSEYNALKKRIFSIFQTLGRCDSSSPVPYDTAWAARIPKFDDLTQPAFSQCLQWLRDHQKEDGSWGEENPRLVHSKILNTFLGILALSQWKSKEDKERIKKGVDAMWRLSEKLPREETENSTFEMILSALVDDGRQLGLNLPYESYEWFATIGKEEVKKVQRNILTNKPNHYWAILEAVGKTLDLHPAYYRSEIKRHGLIAAQPSTTAYILRQARLKGENYVEAEWALERLCLENDGGLPHLYNCDNFDLIYGLDFLTKVGINPIANDKREVAKNAIETLGAKWDSTNGVGFSSRWQFSDTNCTKVAAEVLKNTLKKQEDMTKATKTEEDAMHFTLDQGLRNNSRLAKKVDQYPEAGVISYPAPFLKSLPLLSNVSKYYRFMQAVFELSSGNAGSLSHALDDIVKSQNSDGGWGCLGVSSTEETAYVCLAISQLIQRSSEILYRINFLQLVNYIQSAEETFKGDSLWHWKVSFSSPAVSEAALIAAEYAVFQIQKCCIMTDALNHYKLDFDDVNIFDDTKVIFKGNVLRFDLKSWPKNTEDWKAVKDNLLSILFKEDGPSPYLTATIETCLDFCFRQHPTQLSVEHRTIELVGMIMVFLFDDIVDSFYSDEHNVAERLEELFRTAADILVDKNQDPASVPTFDTPDFAYVIEVLFFLQKAIKENGWNCQNFVEEIRIACAANILVRKDLINNIEFTAKRYLQIHKLSTTLRSCLEQNFMIDGIASSTESENLHVYKKFLDSACKADRLVGEPFSMEKDMKLPTLDNYCLRLQHQYKMSVQEAIQMTVKKANKEILKMHTFKNIIQKDPKYIKYTDLPVRLKYVDVLVDATHVWGVLTKRYRRNWIKNITRVDHVEKDVTFVWNLCFGT